MNRRTQPSLRRSTRQRRGSSTGVGSAARTLWRFNRRGAASCRGRVGATIHRVQAPYAHRRVALHVKRLACRSITPKKSGIASSTPAQSQWTEFRQWLRYSEARKPARKQNFAGPRLRSTRLNVILGSTDWGHFGDLSWRICRAAQTFRSPPARYGRAHYRQWLNVGFARCTRASASRQAHRPPRARQTQRLRPPSVTTDAAQGDSVGSEAMTAASTRSDGSGSGSGSRR